MKIAKLAELSGLTAHTIRYYERIGLLPRADRDAGGRRVYDASILDWFGFLGRLKATGMPIRKMQDYAKLREQGDRSIAERRVLLEEHRATVRSHIAELKANLRFLDTKIDTYVDLEKRMQRDD